jgi:hypothetical protein
VPAPSNRVEVFVETSSSIEVLRNRGPLVFVRLQSLLLDGAVQRVPLFGSTAVVFSEECVVMSDQQVAQPLPREDVKAVIPVVLDFHEGHDETKYRTGLHVAYNLPLTVKRDVAILRDVAKLPRRAETCRPASSDAMMS